MRLKLYLRCTENPVERPGDGGTLVFQGDPLHLDPAYAGATLAVAFLSDEDLRAYPNTKAGYLERVFCLVLEEVDPTVAFPPPAAPSMIEVLEQRIKVAVDAGDMATADNLAAELHQASQIAEELLTPAPAGQLESLQAARARETVVE